MEKLNKDELEKIKLSKTGGRKPNAYMLQLDELEVGEALKIPKKEWKLFSHPSMVVYYTASFKKQGKKFSTKQTEDKTDWILVRTK